MNKLITLGAAALFLAPLASFAATYNYVDSTGMVQAVAAPNAETALETAPNIASNSGVAIASGAPTVSTGTGATVLGASSQAYNYVDANGIVQTVDASSPQQALAGAPNIAPHSGVAIAQ